MNNNYFFSILMSNYNNGKYLQEAIDSVITQTYANWEIILVDDVSTDNSKELYEKYENDKRIKLYYNKKNSGYGYTLRKCAELASGTIYGVLDPDDVLKPDAVEVMVQTHKDNPNAALVYSTCIEMNEDLTKPLHKGPEIKEQVKNGDIYFCNKNGNIGHFTTFKAEYYRRTEGISPFSGIAADQDLYLKLYEVGDAVFVNKCLYKYRIHPGSLSKMGNEQRARYWRWRVLADAAKRRNINFEDEFVKTLVFAGDVWITIPEVRKNPFIIVQRIWRFIKNSFLRLFIR